MLENNGGSIVNTASTAGVVGDEENASYTASKHAVIGLTKSLALEYSSENIRVNSISPGDTKTAIQDSFTEEQQKEIVANHPIGRLAEPSEIARAIVFLASDDASFITGSNLMVDGGFTAK
jgi:NAD(P)-dependent dehydrogenase (short-subunit alcohol dehydrogenase family)